MTTSTTKESTLIALSEKQNYYQLCREERNYAAILYHLLCHKENLETFVSNLPGGGNLLSNASKEPEVYFEYSPLRDLWHSLGKGDEANQTKLKIISDHLPELMEGFSGNVDPEDLNKHFGATNPSKNHIQYPGRWSLGKMVQNGFSPQSLDKIRRFKWAFNIKPDMVIELGSRNAICIELKFESALGSYTGPNGLGSVGQMELQHYLMEGLLGRDTSFYLISQSKGRIENEAYKEITWTEALAGIPPEGEPRYIREMLKNLQKTLGN